MIHSSSPSQALRAMTIHDVVATLKNLISSYKTTDVLHEFRHVAYRSRAAAINLLFDIVEFAPTKYRGNLGATLEHHLELSGFYLNNAGAFDTPTVRGPHTTLGHLAALNFVLARTAEALGVTLDTHTQKAAK